MGKIDNLIGDVNNSFNLMEEAFDNTNERYRKNLETNNEEIVNLDGELKRLSDELSAYETEEASVNDAYTKVEDHITGISSAEYQFLAPVELENMLKEAANKKEAVTKDLSDKKLYTNESAEAARGQIEELKADSSKIEALVPELNNSYNELVTRAEEVLLKLNEDLKSFVNTLNDVKDKDSAKELNEESIQEPAELEEELEVLELEEPEITEEAPTQELAEESVKDEEEELNTLVEPSLENEEEVREVKVVETDDAKEEAVIVEKLVETEPIIDYSMNQYVGIDEMNLTSAQKNNLMRNMSSEKFSQLAELLKEYKIPLADVSPFYDDFLKVEDVSKVKETLSTYTGIGKTNDEKDFSSMLDVLLTTDNPVLQSNLLSVYSQGNNPKNESIMNLSSEHYESFEENAKALGQDAAYLSKVKPFSIATKSVSTVVSDMAKVEEKAKERVA